MRILVTGGTGIVGRAAVERLVQHGHAVRVIGRRADLTVAGAEYLPCDINDYAHLRELMRGMDTVVHLAAIPNPALGSSNEIMRVNCSGSFNVFQAAAQEGIRRVVQASSINALGFNFGVVGFPLRYFPMDEEHPICTTDPYSFSKQVIEEVAHYFWRRDGISSVSLRLPAVYEANPKEWNYPGEFKTWYLGMQQAHRAVLDLPPAERRARVQAIWDKVEARRAARFYEKPYDEQERLGAWNDPDTWLMFGLTTFWTSVDSRDSAQAIEQGLLADYQGSHPLYINDSVNVTGIETRALAEAFYPEVTTWKRPVSGVECLVSIDQARALLGFKPEFSVSKMW
jgi:nucleoside-diphosphate-sugar epimerase